MTLAEFLKLPEAEPPFELRQGRVTQKVPPSGPHSSIQAWFVRRIDVFGDLGETARAFPEARLILNHDTNVPDVVIYRSENIPEDDDGNLPTYFTTPADIVVEVVSPGQTEASLLNRCREMIGHGVRLALLVNPARRTIHALRATREVGPLRDGEAVDVADILPGFDLTVSDLFASLRSRPRRAQGTE
jgi:Uma2 family endonuclease